MGANDLKVTTEVPVRFSDTDAMGHVNNANFFTYMEQGRVAYFTRLLPEVSLQDSSAAFPFILADIQCSFLSPAFCGETLLVELSITEVGRKSFTMQYQISDEATGREVATGHSVQVMYDYEAATTYPIPEDFLKRIEALEGRSFPRK